MPPGITTSPLTGDFSEYSFREMEPARYSDRPGTGGIPIPLARSHFLKSTSTRSTFFLPEEERSVARFTAVAVFPLPRDGAGDRSGLLERVDQVLEPGAQGLELLDEHRVGTEIYGTPGSAAFPHKVSQAVEGLDVMRFPRQM